MNELKVSYPFKPFHITQNWGNPNPAYDQFGFSRHNGVDCRPWYSDYYLRNNYPVYCPVEGFRVHLVRNFPSGGGIEMWLISKDKLKIGDKECHAYMVFAHARKILVPVGYEPKLGELMMIGDNTGFSTGTHTHMGLYRVDFNGMGVTYLDQNDANGSYDPAEFYTNKFAVDQATLPTLIKSNLRYYKFLIGG